MLQLKSISFSYPGQPLALNRISFHLNQQKILGVAGSSGSGKSTLLSAIYGLIDISGGEVIFNRQKVTGPSRQLIPGHGDMRLAGQFHQLQDSLSILEQIKYKLLHYKPVFREKKAVELLSMVGLADKRNQKPMQLSGGQQQLAGLCCAFAEEPQLLLLDEPFNNLDQSAKKAMKDYLISLRNRTKMSIIIVSHDPTDLLSVSDTLLILKSGKKVWQDTPEKVFFEPKNEYVAGLFGAYNKIRTATKTRFIRPSQIRVTEKKTKGFNGARILSCDFYGNEYLYRISDNIHSELIVSSATKLKGNKIYYKL